MKAALAQARDSRQNKMCEVGGQVELARMLC
jgi:hypothetical protein